MPNSQTTGWMFYHDGVYGPAEERELREFSERLGIFSCEKGVASGVMRQMWAEIDRLRARLATLEQPRFDYTSCAVRDANG